tara:strand:+ start:528 stop:638 length:111 start_codon:yes stop_codon:yes gene_type:complete
LGVDAFAMVMAKVKRGIKGRHRGEKKRGVRKKRGRE